MDIDATNIPENMNSYIVIKSNHIQVSEIIQQTPVLKHQKTGPDFLVIDQDTKIGIEESRNIKRFLSTQPLVSSGKTVLINNAEYLTHEAQNALLKTLEEPPLASTIVLATYNQFKLLPTIINRCKLIYLSRSSDQYPHSNIVQDMKSLSVGERLAYLDTFSTDKSKIAQLLTELISYFRYTLHHHPSKKALYNLKLTLYVQKLVNTHVNSRLVIDTLAIRLQL